MDSSFLSDREFDSWTATPAAKPTPLADTLPNPGPVVPSPWPLVPGYEILGELGRGGMAIVYLARQLRANRLVALKMVLHGLNLRQDFLERFRIEAEAVARLQHPHVVQVFEVGEHNGLPYFSMEYCPGGSLEKHLRGTTLTAPEAAALSETLARAIHHTHEAGVIHRDLKPANVLLASGGRPSSVGEAPQEGRPPLAAAKVSDFGLAKRLDVASGPTLTGQFLGTPSYMAPEQAAGLNHATDARTDVYALGALLYECLTGRPPFKEASLEATLKQVRETEPVRPLRLNESLPRDLETICLKCLRKEPEKRYVTALELAEDLRRFQANEPIHARPVGRVERLRKWARRRPAVAALIVLAFLSLAGGALGAVWHTRQLQEQVVRVEAARDQADKERAAAAASRDRLANLVNALWTATVSKDVLVSEQETINGYEQAATALQTYLRQQSDDLLVEVTLSKTYSNLANLYNRQGKHTQSEATYRKAVALQEGLLGRELPPHVRTQVVGFLARSHKLLGNLYSETDALDKAENAYRTALELLAAELPSTEYRAECLEELGAVHGNLANLLRHRGKVPEAKEEYRRALRRYEELERAFPNVRSHRGGLALVCCNFGQVCNETQAAEEGLKWHLRGLRLRQELARVYQGNPELLDELSTSHSGVATSYRLGKQPDPVSAERHHREALQIKETLVRDYPNVSSYRAGLAAAQGNLAFFLIEQKKEGPALLVLAQCVTNLETVLRTNEQNREVRENLILALETRARLYQNQKQLAQAESDRQRARALRR